MNREEIKKELVQLVCELSKWALYNGSTVNDEII